MAGVGLSVEGVEVHRGDRIVLRVPAFAIAPGEALAILGPNGAGKSTLLSVLAGLRRPTTGSARIGESPATLLTARRKISLLPQDAPMLTGTVEDNVARPLALRGVARTERRRRANAVLERMSLGGLASRRSTQLSGGETRRAALARAVVTGPEALLLDEPFNGIDDPSRELLIADIRDSIRAEERTLVLVTQRRDEALRLATRLAVVWEGEIKQVGPIEHVLARPVDPAIARFLGLENVLKGRVTGQTPDGVVVDVGGVSLYAALEAPLPAGANVWIVFAPEQVELRASDDASRSSPRNVLPAQVVSLVPREGRVEVELDARFPLLAVVTRAAVEELGLAPGVGVRAAVKATALHVVPA